MADGAGDLPDHVRALLEPELYPRPTARVDLRQTHISYVLLAGEDVFKLKKPVRFPFLDFTSLEARQVACEAEVQLNRRACSDVYLGVTAVRRAAASFQLGGNSGEVVDYAVHMRRLPDERMMDAMLARGAIGPEQVAALVETLSRFHAENAVDGDTAKGAGFDTLERNWRRNLGEIEALVGRSLGRRRFKRISGYAQRRLAADADILRSREAEGRVKDGHGDLRCDSVCFRGDTPADICLLDCLEFDRGLRVSDVGLEVGFLAMDLDFRGRDDLADLLIGLYASATGDAGLTLLAPHFRCYRACVRGLVDSLTAEDSQVGPRQRGAARRRAKQYFALAERYTRVGQLRGVLLVMGPSGSGKSFLAGALASRNGAALLSTDAVRRRLFGARPKGEERDPVGGGRYEADNRDRVYEETALECATRLEARQAVVLDGSFIEQRHRRAIVELARARQLPFVLVECWAPPETIRERQQARAGQAWTPSEGNWAVYQAQMRAYEAPAEVPAGARITLDTTRHLALQLEEAGEALQSLDVVSGSAP